MPTFAYKARNAEGGVVTGTLVADTSSAAARQLSERTLLPVEVEEVRAAARSVFTGRTQRVSAARIGVVYEQLADLLAAGVPVLRAISVLSKQSTSPALAQVLREVHDDVASGDTFADALEKHPYAFPALHVSMIRAGEKGGFLEDVLQRAAHFVARQDELRNKFVGSMIYPCILLLVGLAAVIFVMSFVVPRIRSLLEQQPSLPLPTRMLFAASDALSHHYMTIIGVVIVAVIAAVMFV
ncbi:MAG TPA: type II secretion system F family protein [Phycisphaerae bacterium]|nr:type II secretion system F family protein [Phycisphaerae bacterium]